MRYLILFICKSPCTLCFQNLNDFDLERGVECRSQALEDLQGDCDCLRDVGLVMLEVGGIPAFTALKPKRSSPLP